MTTADTIAADLRRLLAGSLLGSTTYRDVVVVVGRSEVTVWRDIQLMFRGATVEDAARWLALFY